MKFYASLLCLILVLVSCKNEDKKQDEKTNNETEQNENQKTSGVNTKKNNSEIDYNENEESSIDSPDKKSNNSSGSSKAAVSGETYVKIDEKDANCNCYCLELNMNNNTELCLSEDEIYITARYSKSGNNINMYYANPSSKNTNEELPWEDFDTNTPIAVLSPTDNGNLELDWKGFSINGELAVDYAIYGKKTLEGTYKKQ